MIEIYLAIRDQGDYEEYQRDILIAFYKKDEAEAYVERLKSLYKKAYEFYDGWLNHLDGTDGNEDLQYEVMQKQNYFYGANFSVGAMNLK